MEGPDEDDEVDCHNDEDHHEDVLHKVGWQQDPNLYITNTITLSDFSKYFFAVC